MSRRVTALAHLQDYATLTEAGHSELKACLWQLTKSRRSKNRGMLSLESPFCAGQLREEFHARTLVRNEEESPALVEEEEDDDDDKDSKKKKKSTSSPTTWKLVDALDERNKDKENKENVMKKKSDNGGLRQRKNAKQEEDEEDKEWTVVEEKNSEEELLDPLELFGGLAPRELKVAQQQAKKALESYIQAANQAAAILALLQKENQ
jgi:hypothetical protein